MYASEYAYAASPSAWETTLANYKGNDSNGVSIPTLNWLYKEVDDWLITRCSDTDDSVVCVSINSRFGSGGLGRGNSGGSGENFRPTFSLVSGVSYKSGDGSKSNPFKINE